MIPTHDVERKSSGPYCAVAEWVSEMSSKLSFQSWALELSVYSFAFLLIM